MKKFIFFLFLTLVFAQNIFAQNNGMFKHPKVLEVEMNITKEATQFLQQRYPKDQIFVNVEVEPLRRANGDKTEQLPYFYSEDEVQDEWDGVDTPIVLLLSRIKKANIKVEISAKLSDSELSDLKDKLYQQLKLIPGRDSIGIERKERASQFASNSESLFEYGFIFFMTLVVLTGVFFIMKYTNRGNQAAPQASSSSGGAPISAGSMPMSIPKSSGGKAQGVAGIVTSKVNGDINFKDSIRAADLLKEKLHGVVNAPIFPLLSDMLILEELANKSLSSFGAFVFEMPRKHQQKVFFRGRNDKWLKGYNEATSVDLDCFIAVEKMLRNRTASGSDKWEELLIQVWRLDEDAPLFLKQIPSDDAFTMLAHLPKAFAVPTAKKAYPGGWAKVLESGEAHPFDDEAKVEEYIERTLMLKPFFSFKTIDEYRKELELVDYLRLAPIKDEEDIYESLHPQSQIFKLRPPFYKVFKADADVFKDFFPQFDLQAWAQASINCPRELIKPIFKELDDKKKYIFRNILKQLDEEGVDLKIQAELREEIGKQFWSFVEHRKVHKEQVATVVNEETESENESNDDKIAA